MKVKLPFEEESKIGEILKVLRKRDNFLITSHINSDGDAIGSELALYITLKSLNKKVEIINQDKIPAIFKFLPYSDEIKIFKKELKKLTFNVSIVIDSGNIDRIGDVKYIVENSRFLVNIDHHVTNSSFGNINWTNPEYSSCGEMIYLLLERLGQIEKQQAICLYTSILYDTCGFIHHLSKYTLEIVKNLYNIDIKPEEIARKIFYERSISSVRLLKLCLKTIKYSPKYKLCTMKVKREFYDLTKAKEEDTEGFVEFLVSIKGVEIAILFKEKKDGIKVSMRSKGKVDVENIAKKFGGGGHREAAGCFFKNLKMNEVENIIMKEIKWMAY